MKVAESLLYAFGWRTDRGGKAEERYKDCIDLPAAMLRTLRENATVKECQS